MFLLVGYLRDIDKVRKSLEDHVVSKFLKNAIFNEICPTLDLPKEKLDQFSTNVLNRFRNPFLEYELMSISLNSVSKLKTRVLPIVLGYVKQKNEFPKYLLFSLASLFVFYKVQPNGHKIAVKDDKKVLDFFGNPKKK